MLLLFEELAAEWADPLLAADTEALFATEADLEAAEVLASEADFELEPALLPPPGEADDAEPLLEADLAADADFEDFATEEDLAMEVLAAETEAETFETEVFPAAEPEAAVVLVDPEYPLAELPLTVLPIVDPEAGETDAEAEVLLALLAPETAETPDEESSEASMLPLV